MIRRPLATKIIVKHVSVMDKSFKKLTQTFGVYIGTPPSPILELFPNFLDPRLVIFQSAWKGRFMDIHNMDLFLLLSHLAANYFKTHDENSNLHFA